MGKRARADDRSRRTTTRWVRSVADEHAVAGGCYFDERAGNHIVEFFSRHLCHTKGQWTGEPFVPLDFQRAEILMPLFGWKSPDGRRRFRMAYMELAKKSGKSALCAGIALYLLGADEEDGAEVYCAAAEREQAGIVYREASMMAKASPLLRDYIIPRDSVKNLALPSSNSFLRVISADAHTAEGLNASGVIFDELHSQRTRDLWDTLRYSGAARRQPLLVAISTAGWDRHSICYEVHTRARQVLEGTTFDDSFFAYIRAADELDDWTSPATWRKANPALGVITSEEDLARDCQEAQESPAKENAFRRYRLCQWTEQAVRWLPLDKWDLGADAVDASSLRRRRCFGGLDLSTTTDLTALVLLFPKDGGDGYMLLAWFWAPRENARMRSRRDGVAYLDWAQQGYLTLTDGDVCDYAVLRRDINRIATEYGIEELAVDRVFQGCQLCTELAGDGLNVVPFGQGFLSMAAPAEEFERLVIGGKLQHGGHPIMRWMAGNVSVELDAAGNMKPSKARSTDRIDGVVAAIMALGVASKNCLPAKRSVYEDRGIRVLSPGGPINA